MTDGLRWRSKIIRFTSIFNAYDNMALGLRLRDFPRNIIDSRVNDAAKLLGISGVLGQKIKALSERDKQKVALGRAIVCQPKVLLVDEDFARQDPERRKEMLCDILEINEELKITVLYVTNDPLEARTLGKKIVFMKDGQNNRYRITSGIGYFLVSFTTF